MDYREVIKAEFIKRKTLNPYYSLRQFAKELELYPSHLCYLLKGERGLSKEKAHAMARTLNLKPIETAKFCFLVEAQSGRSKKSRNLAKQGLKKKRIAEARLKV